MSNRALGIAIVVSFGAIVLIVGGSIVFSPALCDAMPSYDACKRAPVCAAGVTDGVDGPGWFCRSRFRN